MSDEENTEDIKIILLGESGVGKTNLINVLLDKPFIKDSHSSLSTSYSKGTFNYKNKEYPYTLWDTAGQESYRSLNKFFIRQSNLVFFVFSIDNAQSFSELDYWINSAKQELDENCVMAILGNKYDLYEDQKVSEKEVENYAKKQGMKFKFTSAISDVYGLKKFFNELILDYIKGNFSQSAKNNKDQIKDIALMQPKKKKKKFC